MEARNITIVSTRDQSKHVINTDATTLRELKAALSASGVDYDGMTFYEGLSHTELLTDDSVLPHDVPYKGEITNELVFMLTNPNKKIKSGANLSEARKALYDAIEELGLKDACVTTYGRNFTQCKNSELMSLVENAQEKLAEGNSKSNVEKALELLIDVLVEEEYLYEENVEHILKVLHGTPEEPKAQSRYSEDELNDMFEFLD